MRWGIVRSLSKDLGLENWMRAVALLDAVASSPRGCLPDDAAVTAVLLVAKAGISEFRIQKHESLIAPYLGQLVLSRATKMRMTRAEILLARSLHGRLCLPSIEDRVCVVLARLAFIVGFGDSAELRGVGRLALLLAEFVVSRVAVSQTLLPRTQTSGVCCLALLCAGLMTKHSVLPDHGLQQWAAVKNLLPCDTVSELRSPVGSDAVGVEDVAQAAGGDVELLRSDLLATLDALTSKPACTAPAMSDSRRGSCGEEMISGQGCREVVAVSTLFISPLCTPVM